MRPAAESVDLRRGVDHIGVTVNFIIHDGNGRILLQKRSLKCRDEQGRWDIGGGAVEFGETLEDAVRREIMEELCVSPISLEFIQVYDAHRDNQGIPTHWVAINFAAQVDPNKVKIGEPERIDEIGWFRSDTLPQPLHSQFFKSYAVALEKKIIS